jgi:hypothetical protein
MGSARLCFEPRKKVMLSLALVISIVLSARANAQTASRGAVVGVALDPSGSVVPGVLIRLATIDANNIGASVSDSNGWFGFYSVAPDIYQLHASKEGFDPLTISGIDVHVTETLRVELHLALPKVVTRSEVYADALMISLDSSALGRVVNEQAASGLPLVTRNFVQIVGLSPGVSAGVTNAGELGNGDNALSQIGKSSDGIYVRGSRSYDNNWQLDGISVSDIQGSGSSSGGIPTPNPDAIREFKMQTALYDASFGRGAGGNVSVVTKAGGNEYHGALFEYFRNDALNANDFFRNLTHQRRPVLKQNQFGFTFGGPVRRDKMSFFTSYQGTRQTNGLASGQARIACAATLSEPPLTNDRSPAALGQLFGGLRGALGGVAVKADGSNINPVALILLNRKLPDGSFLIPTPQTIDPSRPFASRGFSAFSEPCQFNEEQGLFNLDYTVTPVSRIAVRFFVAHDDQRVTFPGNGMNPSGNTRGFVSPGNADFVVLSLAHSHVSTSGRINEARFGFVSTSSGTSATAPFAWSDVGVAEGLMNNNNQLPSLSILGSLSMASGFPRTYTQRSFVLSDVFSLLAGAHTVQFGGSLTRLQDDIAFAGLGSYVQFLSWPDFLLGFNGSGNGTGTFSNVSSSIDGFGLFDRHFRAWEISGFVQDNYHINRTLTLNLGLRYERPGVLGDNLGRSSSFDVSKADPNPPVDGTLSGYVVASNFAGVLPPGVVRADNTAGIYGRRQNTFAPRVGFAWQILPEQTRLALRGGYGMYFSRPTGQAFTQSLAAAPFALARVSSGPGNVDATFQAPFAQPFPTPASFPLFTPYTPTTNTAVTALTSDFRPASVQQFSLNLQAELVRGWLFEAGYVGSRGTHLQRLRALNQALAASPDHPIRGVTSNTLANIPLRVRIRGIRPDSIRQMEAGGISWYHALEASLTKRLSYGFQFLISYTFSKTLDTDGAEINGISAANTLTYGDQNSPSQRWGRASFDRTHRFVFSTTWTLPSPTHRLQRGILGGWSIAAIATIQSGVALTITNTNSTNVFGITQDRAQLSGVCSKAQLVNGGAVQSKLNRYFDPSCFVTPPVIGADGRGTAFGDSATGIVNGPGQANLDVAFSKTIRMNRLVESSSIQFRAEFFNALNHPQFANPDTNFASPTFGVINSTAVNARVGQLAVKFAF